MEQHLTGVNGLRDLMLAISTNHQSVYQFLKTKMYISTYKNISLTYTSIYIHVALEKYGLILLKVTGLELVKYGRGGRGGWYWVLQTWVCACREILVLEKKTLSSSICFLVSRWVKTWLVSRRSSSSKSLLYVTFRHKRSFKWHCNR